jgi:hypothetical protein
MFSEMQSSVTLEQCSFAVPPPGPGVPIFIPKIFLILFSKMTELDPVSKVSNGPGDVGSFESFPGCFIYKRKICGSRA